MNLAVGFFDGVHLGHRRILASADAALTFTNHPLSVLAPERAPALLMSAAERLEELRWALAEPAARRAEPRLVRALDFTPAFARLAPEDFVARLRREFPAVDTVLCGANWRFGRGGAGDADFLRARGLDVVTAPYATWRDAPVSSTRIRAALAEGRVADAAAMLGRAYRLTGEVRAGKGLGRTLGFPTVNVVCAHVPDLARGVYAVEVPGFGAGVANWGTAPTCGAAAWRAPQLEIHFTRLERAGAFPASTVHVALCAFIRPERRFATLEDLRRQLARDVAAVGGPFRRNRLVLLVPRKTDRLQHLSDLSI